MFKRILFGMLLTAALVLTGCPDPNKPPEPPAAGEMFTYEDTAKTIIDGLTADGKAAASLTIPATVREIADGAFSTATELSSVTFDGQIKLGDAVFVNTKLGDSLISVLQNRTLQKTGLYQGGQESITKGGLKYSTFTISGDKTAIVIGMDPGNFDNSDPLWFPAKVDIDGEHNLIGIRDAAFQGRASDMSNITEVRFGSTEGGPAGNNFVIEIGKNAFDGISTITKVDFGNSPSGGVTVGEDAFKDTGVADVLTEGSGYSSINSANVGSHNGYTYSGITRNQTGAPSGGTIISSYSGSDTALDFDITGAVSGGATEIAAKALMGNENITEVTIPSSVTKIGNQAFSGCTALDTVTFSGTPPQLGDAYTLEEVSIIGYVYDSNKPDNSQANVFENTELNIVHELWRYQVPGDGVRAGTYSFVAEKESGNFRYELFTVPGSSGSENKAVAVGVKSGLSAADFSEDSDYTIQTVDDGGTLYTVDALINSNIKTSLGSKLAFEDASLTKILLPDGLKVLGPGVLGRLGNNTLTESLTIPGGVTLVGPVFVRQKLIPEITFKGSCTASSNAFDSSAFASVVPIGSNGSVSGGPYQLISTTDNGITYRYEDGHGAVATAVTDPGQCVSNGVLSIPDTVDFGGTAGVQDVVEIGDGFLILAKNIGIKNISLGVNVDILNTNSFNSLAASDNELNTNNATTLRGYAFGYSEDLKKVVLPQVTEMGGRTFFAGNDFTLGQQATLTSGSPFTTYYASPAPPKRFAVMRSFAKMRSAPGGTIPAGQYKIVGDDYTAASGTVYRAFAYDPDGDGDLSTGAVEYSASVITGADEAILNEVSSDNFNISGTAFNIPVEVIDMQAYKGVTFAANTTFNIPANIKYIDSEAFMAADASGNGITSVVIQGSDSVYVGDNAFANIPGVSAAIVSGRGDKTPGTYPGS